MRRFNIDRSDIVDPTCPNILFFRHLESVYNVYKRTSKLYQAFLKEEDPETKRQLAEAVIEEFMDIVQIDPLTPLTEDGILDGQKK